MAANGSPATPQGGKAHRVYLILRDEIAAGMHPCGSPLPAEHRLAEIFAVSRVTVRRALDALAGDGLIDRRPGSGTVVTLRDAPPQMARADFATLMPQLVEMEAQTTARLLAFSYCAAPEAVAAALEIAPGAQVQRAVRVRLISGRPFSHLTTHVPADVAQAYSETDLATAPLFRLLERSGCRIHRATQSVSAALATPEVAEAMEVSVGSALLSLTRVVYDAEGRGVEHLAALYRPDRFRLEMTLDRVGAPDARRWSPVPVAETGAEP
ncbi:MAG: GntR family transcriptional regulator [Pseudomonadota bacterium]